MELTTLPVFWAASGLVILFVATAAMGLFGGNRMPVDGKVRQTALPMDSTMFVREHLLTRCRPS